MTNKAIQDLVTSEYGKKIWWPIQTAKRFNRHLLNAGGLALGVFSEKLQNFQKRIMPTYSELKSSEFDYTNMDGNMPLQHCRGDQRGLSALKLGLTEGLGQIVENAA